MKEKALKPGVLWGQHRTSELLAMGVKNWLQRDRRVANAIPFLEYERYRYDDYIELLYRQLEAEKTGVSEADFNEKIRPVIERKNSDYEERLSSIFSPLLSNLHDGYQMMADSADIEFRIPAKINDADRLEGFLQRQAKRHGLKLMVEKKIPDSKVTDLTATVVAELMVPSPEKIMVYPSEEVRLLEERFVPPNLIRPSPYTHMVIDTSNILYKSTVERYAQFMKDVLLGERRLRIS